MTHNELRDLRIGDDLNRKAELGWFDKEFHIYGVAYWMDDRRYYRLSTDSRQIYRFMDKLALAGCWTSNVLSQSERCAVPSGTQQTIALAAKIALAQKLADNYPADLFIDLQDLASKCREDYAFPWLDSEKEKLEGLFQEDLLRRFQHTVEYCYRILALSDAHYQALTQWLADEWRYLGDSYIRKEAHVKTFYGIAYLHQNKLHYDEDALLDFILREKDALERSGAVVSPIFEQTYYYTYLQNILDIRQQFIQDLRVYYDPAYMAQLDAFSRQPNQAIDKHWVQSTWSHLSQTYSDLALQTFQHYLKQWRIIAR